MGFIHDDELMKMISTHLLDSNQTKL